MVYSRTWRGRRKGNDANAEKKVFGREEDFMDWAATVVSSPARGEGKRCKCNDPKKRDQI